jgi:hypothetical protein
MTALARIVHALEIVEHLVRIVLPRGALQFLGNA